MSGCLDEIIGRGERFDVMLDFAKWVPIRVICKLFGIERPDYERLGRWGTVLGSTLDGARTLREQRQAVRTVAEMGEFFDGLIAQRRRSPGDDALSGLVNARHGGESLSRRELVATAGQLLGAGFETTVNLIGNGVLALLANPESKRLLVERPEMAASLADEVLHNDRSELPGRMM
ncbi:MAG: cytochrome P450 [Sciscionella sp.]